MLILHPSENRETRIEKFTFNEMHTIGILRNARFSIFLLTLKERRPAIERSHSNRVVRPALRVASYAMTLTCLW